MTLHDNRGNPVSATRRQSVDGYDAALELLHGYYGDPLGAIEAVLAEDPEFVMGHCFRAALMVISSEAAAVPALRQSVEAAERLMARANDRERIHIAAARAWIEGDFERAVWLYGSVLTDYPRDGLALQVAHLGDFFLGQSRMLRDRIAAVLPRWHTGVPGYGFALGMHAFGLEEMGEYGRAEESGRAALALNPRDPWATHAVAHVMEMQGRQPEGIRWLEDSSRDWAPDNGFAFHNWWHLALQYLDLGDHPRVLNLYDEGVRPHGSNVVLELIDASALLWRLHLRGASVGKRWGPLADIWAGRIDESYYAFNDVHAMMALVADGRESDAERLLANLERRATQGGTNGMMSGEVGIALARALRAFGREDYKTCAQLLLPVRFIAHRFGGSHAQRDLIHLTLTEAATRAGMAPLAQALAEERVEIKPTSPHNWTLLQRARLVAINRRGAEEAQLHSVRAQHTAISALRALTPEAA